MNYLETAPRAVIRWIAQGGIGSSSGFSGLQACFKELRTFHIPLACVLFIRLARITLTIWKPLRDAAHKLGQFGIGLLRLFLECCCGSPALHSQHGAKTQPIEQCLRHHADRPAAEVQAFIILHPGLRHLHKSGFFEDRNGPLTTALADTRFSHDGAHIYVNKTTEVRRSAQTHGSKVKVGQDCFQNDLTGLTAFRAGASVRMRLQGRAFLWMVEPYFCAFRRQRQDARQAAFAFSYRPGRGKVRIIRVMPATMPGHISTPRG